MKAVCIIGIDTDIGKTLITGLLAKSAQECNMRVATMKPVQTGCVGQSEDIIEHRRLMGIDQQDYDRDGLSCPYLFTKPCSPALAAELEGREIEFDLIARSLEELLQGRDLVLLEGAGGLMVPLNQRKTFLDLLIELNVAVILVSTNRLGSINHTLMSLEVLKQYGVSLLGVVYNVSFNDDKLITENTKATIMKGLERCGYPRKVVELPVLDMEVNSCLLDVQQFLR